MKQKTDILYLYFYREPFGPTVMDHIESIERYSAFSVLSINLAESEATYKMRMAIPKVIVLHYTVFGMQWYQITDEQSYILAISDALKVAFFQDEYYQCPKRFRYIDEVGIDCVYTLFEPGQFRKAYYDNCRAKVIKHTLAGYVSEGLLNAAQMIHGKNIKRIIDVGYRGNRLDITFGMEGREKWMIADLFKKHAEDRNMGVDIETAMDKRIYGPDWYTFIASCKAMLGVEAGVSLVDIDDTIRTEAFRLRKEQPNITDEEIYERICRKRDHNIYYRMISPRHFEAAAFNSCQVLFEGKYTGLMDPDVHYIPLKKDFSNIDNVLSKFNDDAYRREIAENARRDLIDSGRFTYARFVADLDTDLRLYGIKPTPR